MAKVSQAARTKQPAWVGQPLRRKEDRRLITGLGRYIDDIEPPGVAHAAILRSHYPHARIVRIDTSLAERLPGVLAVLVGREVGEMTEPFPLTARVPVKFYCMAVDKVRYVGEPVAAVAAKTPGVAEDALDLIDVEYEPLPPVVNAGEGGRDAPPIHDGVPDNLVWRDRMRYGDTDEAFAHAYRVVEETLTFHRNAPAPIETFGCIAAFESSTNRLTITYNGQIPNVDGEAISVAMRLPRDKLRLVVPDVGGAFGSKCAVYPYAVLTGLLSKKAGTAVKWIESRAEHLTAGAQTSGRRFKVRMALSKSGRILGLETRILEDVGAYPKPPEPVGVLRPLEVFTGCYKIENLSIDFEVVMTNKCPSAPCRGYGVQHHYFMLERMMDIAARELEIDPAQIRFENFIGPEDFPYTTPIGCVYDSGSYPELLRTLLDKIDYASLRRRKSDLQDGVLVGVGLSTIVEPGGSNFSLSQLFNPELSAVSVGEAATVKLDVDGKISLFLGATPQGQGAVTVASQIIADELGVSPDDVNVHLGFDSDTHPSTYTSGTFSSKFASVGVGAITLAARQLKRNLAEIGAEVAGGRPTDAKFEAGRITFSEVRDITLAEVAGAARGNRDWSNMLQVTSVYTFPGLGAPDSNHRGNFSATYASSAHAAVVAVDPAVGSVKLLRYVAVHDCGRAINPLIVEGQVRGGVVQGIGGALSEECYYDSDGQCLNSTFMDYVLPASTDTVGAELTLMETPSPFTALGTKGVGEGGAMASPAAVANAVEDALLHLGVRVRALPILPDRLWEKIRAASPEATKARQNQSWSGGS